MKICVVGLGYIGLPTASLLATKGHTVTGVDISPEVVETINRGHIHIVEPDLEVLMPYAAKERPVILNVSSAADILAAIDFVKELDVEAILRGCREAWKVPKQLAE